MTWKTTAIAMTIFGVLGLAGCHPDGGDASPPRAARSIEIAKEVCEVDALAEEHHSLMTKVDTMEGGVPDTQRDESWTILMQKLRDYRAEIDASYRFVTANCKTFNMCMLSHHYEEGQCQDSRESWMVSHQRFNDLAVELAQLESRHHPWRPGPRPHCGFGCSGDQVPPPPGPCRERDCDPTGGAFSSSCCLDRHSGD